MVRKIEIGASKPDALLSYARIDDEHQNGGITWLKGELERGVRVFATGSPFVIFQDVEDVAPGDDWDEKLNLVLESTQLLIPILTPSFFESRYCRRETTAFLDREGRADSNALIVPIYLFEAEVLENPRRRAGDELAVALHKRQYDDWREFRHKLRDPNARLGADIGCRIEGLAETLARAAMRSAKKDPRAGREYIIWRSESSIDQTYIIPEVDKQGEVHPQAVRDVPRFIDRVSDSRLKWALYLIGLLLVTTVIDIGSEWVRYLKKTVVEQNRKVSEEPQKSLELKEVDYNDSDKTFSDCEQCPEMVVLPSGSFLMGSPADEQGRDSDEGPQRQVTIGRPFALGKYEVTRAQFGLFVSDTGHEMAGCRHWDGESWVDDRNRNWGNPGYQQTDDHPVVCVSWKDARAYIRWLSSKTGRDYRLPSEAEWEYAARAGSTTPFFWGEETDRPCSYANGLDAVGKQINGLDRFAFSCNDGHAQTAPVGSFGANALGLHDMAGNVWEWVEDTWHRSYQDAPIDGSAWTKIGNSWRVHRGGSWSFNPWNLRSANRRAFTDDERNFGIGFRVAMTLSR